MHNQQNNALANESNELEEMASMIIPRTVNEVKALYEALVLEARKFKTGSVKLHDYPKDDNYIGVESEGVNSDSGSDQSKEKKRKKANSWTIDEHEKFLSGLEKYGKGDWRSISRLSVLTRTPNQVASHAQKYFLKQEQESAATTATAINNNNKRKA
ncbi:transcription factor SRM1-like [Bidens hawaiensis]|uniref:transcription factor SRM1-like n=1 Tax=Bidens hawaiensis TaxID=980011 RepID=UPI0040496120